MDVDGIDRHGKDKDAKHELQDAQYDEALGVDRDVLLAGDALGVYRISGDR